MSDFHETIAEMLSAVDILKKTGNSLLSLESAIAVLPRLSERELNNLMNYLAIDGDKSVQLMTVITKINNILVKNAETTSRILDQIR